MGSTACKPLGELPLTVRGNMDIVKTAQSLVAALREEEERIAMSALADGEGSWSDMAQASKEIEVIKSAQRALNELISVVED